MEESPVGAAIRLMEQRGGEYRAFLDTGFGQGGLETVVKGRTALGQAAVSGHVDLARALIQAQACVDSQDAKACEPPITAAAFRGHADIVRELAQAGANVDVVNAAGRSALVQAVGRGHVAVVRALVQADAAVSATDKHGHTPLDLALTWRQVEIQDVLKAAGARLSQRITPEAAAAIALLEQNVKYQDWMRAGARFGNLNVQAGKGKNTLLIEAANHANMAVLETLLRAGAELNTTNKFGETALIRSAMLGHEEVVRRLAQAGADLHVRNTFNESALDLAGTIHDVLIELGAT